MRTIRKSVYLVSMLGLVFMLGFMLGIQIQAGFEVSTVKSEPVIENYRYNCPVESVVYEDTDTTDVSYQTNVAFDYYTLGESLLMVNLEQDGEGTLHWTFYYKAKDEIEAATAYWELCTIGNAMKELADEVYPRRDSQSSITVELPNGRFVSATGGELPFGQNNDGTFENGLPDWFKTENIDRDGEVGQFIASSIIWDFMAKNLKGSSS